MQNGLPWGEVATAVQKRDARAVLSVQGPRRHWIGRSRGYSKTDDLAALTLVALLVVLRPAQEAYCVARDRDQARILIDRIKGFIQRTGLEGAFESIGNYVLVTRAGVRLEALSADVGSAWGLSPAWVVVDELCQHPETSAARDLFEAMVSGMPKVAGSRMAIITTAGSPGHWSRSVFDQAQRDPSWRVSMAEGPAPWMDRAEIEAARRSLPESAFVRLFENQWAQTEDCLFEAADVDACVHLDGTLAPVSRRSYVCAVDASLRNDRTAVIVAHLEHGRAAEAVVVVDSLDVFAPRRGSDVDLGAVEELLLERSRRYGRAPVIYDPAGMWQMAQRLSARGVRTIEHAFTVSSNSRRTLLLLQIVREHRLRIPRDEDLIGEMLNLRVREVGPNQYRTDHDPSKHDDRVTALSLAVLQLLEHPLGKATIVAPRGVIAMRSKDSRQMVKQLHFADGRASPILRGSVQAALVAQQLRRHR